MSPKTKFVFNTFPAKHNSDASSNGSKSSARSETSEKYVCVPIYGIKGQKK
jgi:hypothetical protein